MNRVRRFLTASAAEKWLFCKAWFLVFTVRVSLWTLRYARTTRWLGRLQRDPPARLARDPLPAVRVARLVSAASRLVPDGSHCLTRALTTETLLRRRGYPTELKIGVARGDDDKLLAHAWLSSDGEILIGGETSAKYTELRPAGDAAEPAAERETSPH